MNPVKISKIPITSSLFDILACVKACIESSMTLNSSAELVNVKEEKKVVMNICCQSVSEFSFQYNSKLVTLNMNSFVFIEVQ